MVDESLHLDMDTCRWNGPLVNLDSWVLPSVRVKEGRKTVDVEQKDESSGREPGAIFAGDEGGVGEGRSRALPRSSNGVSGVSCSSKLLVPGPSRYTVCDKGDL